MSDDYDELEELDAPPADLGDLDDFEQVEEERALALPCVPRTIQAYYYRCAGGLAQFTTSYCVDQNYPAYTARAGFYLNDVRKALTAPYVRHASAYPGAWISGNLAARGVQDANRMIVYWWKGDIYDPGTPLVRPPASKWYTLPACR